MKNKILIIILIVLNFGLIFSSYKIYDSTRYQTFLLWDFNNDQFNVPYEIYAEKLPDNYPNISLTSIPIKVLKARYFMNIDSTNIAKELLFDAIKVNPYLKGPEAMLSHIYFNEKKYDSSLFYSKEAFYQLPNVNAHRHQYFKNLTHFKDSTELDNAFNMIKDYRNPNHWYEYFTARYKIVGSNDQKVLNLLDEFRIKFPDEDERKLNDIENFIKVGGEEYSLSYLISQEANKNFQDKNFTRAAELYESAILLNSEEYIFYENAAISYAFLSEYDKAFSYYDKVIYTFQSKNGKSEYLKGLLKIQLNEKKQGCDYLRKSSQKKYVDIDSGLNSSQVFISLCN